MLPWSTSRWRLETQFSSIQYSFMDQAWTERAGLERWYWVLSVYSNCVPFFWYSRPFPVTMPAHRVNTLMWGELLSRWLLMRSRALSKESIMMLTLPTRYLLAVSDKIYWWNHQYNYCLSFRTHGKSRHCVWKDASLTYNAPELPNIVTS